MKRDDGFMLRPWGIPGKNRSERNVCRYRGKGDNSYRHCGCFECRQRRNREYGYRN